MLKKKLKVNLNKAKAKISSSKQGVEPIPDADFEQLDKQTIQEFNTSRLPTWQQLKHISRYLGPREKKVIKISGLIIGICVVALIISFYFNHSVLIPTDGGQYTEGLVGSPNYINPLLAQYNDVDRDLSKLLFNGLLKYDEQSTLVLDLAEQVEIAPNQKEYLFTLKNNIFWHDGEPLTTDDVAFTIISIQDPNWQSPYRLAFANIKVEKIDDYKIKFTLTEPLANFLNSMTVGIIPEHLWLSIPSTNVTLVELNKKPIGTGPLKFTSLTKDKNGNIRTMVLERYENYHDKVLYLDTVTFKFYGDYETGVQALKNDNVQGLNLLPKEYRDQLTKNKNLIFHQLSLPQYIAVFFNTKKNDLLKDKALRQGLAYAIDRQKILDQALHQEGQIIDGPILPGYLGYTDELTSYDYNVDEANKLLDKTGWLVKEGSEYRTKNESELSFTLTTVSNPEYQTVLEIIKAGWEAVGVKTNLEIIPKERIKPNVIEPRNYEALLFGQIIKSDPYPFWHSSQTASPGVNLSIWGHKGIDDLLEKARVTTDTNTRADQYKEFQKILTDYLPAIFLYNPIHLYPVTDKIQGINTKHIVSPADRFNNITNWYSKTKREFSWRQPEAQ